MKDLSFKKIVVAPGIIDLNRGDQALVWLIKDLLEQSGIFPDIKILQNANSEEDICPQTKQSVTQGYDLISAILLHPSRNRKSRNIVYSFSLKMRWGFTALKDFITSSLLLSPFKICNKLGNAKLDKKQLETYQAFQDMDVLIVKGGGFLHSYRRFSDIYYLYYSLFNIMLAQRLGKKTIIMPNSFGPFLGRIERRIAKRVLGKCDLIYAREKISKDYLEKLLNKEIYLSADLGFYISPSKNELDLTKLGLSSSDKTVAITMRPYRFPEYPDAEARYKNYIDEMYLVSKELIVRGYHPVFVAHTLGPNIHEDDRMAIHEILEKLKQAEVPTSEYSYLSDPSMDCYAISKLYAQFDYIIGTRFHSVIFAMRSLVPAIAISYSGHKSIGIMTDMGLEDYVLEMGEIDSKLLLEKFEKLVAEKAQVKMKIQDYLLKANQQKEKMLDQVQQILESS